MIIVPKQSLQGVKFPFKWKFCLINAKEAVQFQEISGGSSWKKNSQNEIYSDDCSNRPYHCIGVTFYIIFFSSRFMIKWWELVYYTGIAWVRKHVQLSISYFLPLPYNHSLSEYEHKQYTSGFNISIFTTCNNIIIKLT